MTTLWVWTTVDDETDGGWVQVGKVEKLTLALGVEPLPARPILDATWKPRVSGSVAFQASLPSTMSWPSLRAIGPGFGVSDKLGYDLEDDE